MRRRVVVMLVIAGCTSLLGAQESAHVRLRPATAESRQAIIEVQHLTSAQRDALATWSKDDPRWLKLLIVRVDSPTGDNPALAGKVTLTDKAIHFQPRYSLQPGLTYAVEFDAALLDGKSTVVKSSLTVPRADAKPTTVVDQIYPTSDTLPENHLRFYLQFSAPMSFGDAYARIHLLDGDGKEISVPFLELAEEMWSSDRTRLTLLIHPGRIKRGLRSFEEGGPVLFVGKKYSLVIDADWPDGNGVRLKTPFKKTFTVTEPHTAGLNSGDWKVTKPAEKSRDTLRIDFPTPLDWALLDRMVTVVGRDGRTIPGKVTISTRETRWEFTPESPWQPGAALRIDPALEDPCGNRLGRPFDLDITQEKPKTSPTPAEPITIPIVLSRESQG